MKKLYLNNEAAIKQALEITKIALESGNINFDSGSSAESNAIEIATFYHTLVSELISNDND